MKRLAPLVFLLLVATLPAQATDVSTNITTNTTWTLGGSPYILTNSVTVGSAAGAALTIQAGVVVKGVANAVLTVNSGNKGTLIVNGTAASPVRFTANGTQAAGSWGGLVLGATAGAAQSTLTYAVVEYGGSTAFARGGITVAGNTPALDHVTIQNNQYAGLLVSGGSATVTSSVITSNGGPGLHATGGTSLTLTNNQFAANAGYAVSLPVGVVLTSASGNSASGNGSGRDAIEYRAGTITANTAWPAPGIPYVVTGTIDVMAASAPVLTIAPGNTIKFNHDSQISCNHSNKGALQANGTASLPILFTSNTTTTAGSWFGLWFGPTANPPQSRVSFATIEYAGSSAFARGGIAVNAALPQFDHVTVRTNLYAGVSFSNGAPSITSSAITGNDGPGIRATGGAGLTLTGTAITGNNGYAVTLPVTAALASGAGNSASGNGTGRDAIEYRAGTITADTTWPVPGIPYVVTGTIDVMAASAPVLTIAPGNTIRFNHDSQISCNHSNKGALQANGTVSLPILFTSNTTSTAGAWFGLWFGPTANPPQSRVSYATIEYAGSSAFARGGIAVNAASPQFDHVTVRTNLYAGISLSNGSPVVAGSAITGNEGPGIRATGGSGLTLTNNAITGNNGYAVTLPVGVALGSSSGNSASGNTGGDALEYRAGTITASISWPAPGIPYVVTGTIDVMSTNAPVLTIAPGNTIRFNHDAQISCNQSSKGALQANGTAKMPILFTTNTTSTAGSWLGLWFGPTAGGPPSSVSYATIEYAGSDAFARGGISVNAGGPQFDHVILRNHLFAGLVAANGSSPRITSSQFSGNPRGLHTTSGASAQAVLNYWSSSDGPCLPGQCASGQQSSTAAVRSEPWLVAPPADPLFLTSAAHRNPAFNPSIGTATWIDYAISLSGTVELTIRNSSGTVVRTLTAAGSPGTVAWNGENESGTIQPDGIYRYDIAATAAPHPPATIARGVTTIDSTRVFTLTDPSVSMAFFSPNSDAVQDDTSLAAATNYEESVWTVSVFDGTGNIVRTQSGSGLAVSFTWDGRDGASTVQPDGLYTFRVEASIPSGSVGPIVKTKATTIDNTLPVAVLSSPAASAVLSNIFTNGTTVVTPAGSAVDANFLRWDLQVGTGAAPTSWANLSSSATPVSNGNFANWETVNASGPYSLRLLSYDKAGNSAKTTTAVIVGHFKMTQSAYQFNAFGGGTLSYTSTIPFALTETILIRNLAGTVVRHLVTTAARDAGTFVDTFDGRGDSTVLLSDGPYFYSATVTAGGETYTWDLSNVMRTDPGDFNDSLGVQAYDPFNNRPFAFNYNFGLPGRVSVATTTTPGDVTGDCLTPSATFFCPAVEMWQEAGPQTFTWWGIDHNGEYRTIRSVAIITENKKFPKNAVVLFGTKPKVQNVRVGPPVFGPAAGEQAVEFDLTTVVSKPVSISVAWTSLSSKTVLRTLSISEQGAGHVVVRWDGRADNGMLVAPGRYSVVVTAIDGFGNVVRNGILTTIKY